MLQLSKGEKEILQSVKAFRIIAISIILIGIAGLGLGFYSMWFRPMTQDAKRLLVTLIGYSIGFIIVGWLLNKICCILQKIKEQMK